MTQEEIPNPPAFPVAIPGSEKYGWHPVHIEGMTLRDYFAARALTTFNFGQLEGYYEDYAKSAYMMADAMLKARQSI